MATWKSKTDILEQFAVQGGQKNWQFVLYALTSSNIDRFSNLFHYQNQENTCNSSVTKDSTPSQVCRYTTLWNVSVLKATIENKTTSVTTLLRVRRPAARRIHIEHLSLKLQDAAVTLDSFITETINMFLLLISWNVITEIVLYSIVSFKSLWHFTNIV